MAVMTQKRRSPWRDPRKRREALAAYAFISPYLITTLIFTVGVIAFAVYISFTHYNLYSSPEWVGLQNYVEAITKEDFRRGLVNVGWYVLIVVPTQTALAILLAVLLNTPIRGQQFFRTIFYGPSVTSSVVISMIFWWLYLKTGFLNLFLTRALGLVGVSFKTINWLNDPRGLFQLIVQLFGGDIPTQYWYLRGPSITWMAIMFQNIFTTAPTFMVMFLAALQDIPLALYEAAAIDGANKRQQFWKITLPMLRPIILLVVVLGTIGTFQIFDQVKILTGGGPLKTTLTPVFLIYRDALGTTGPPRMGLAAAMAFLLAAIIFVFTFIQRRLIERGTEQY
ncbi:MAG: sugar ABC transporter permease [Anaerolineae bacterium]|jgi:multiple sugar transport system permease protein|nr:sugar ABC transporter permease [Anaerolineae bacterium]MDH7473643.1 sugar ABC transporter permease [Anaerolineae bacterium]